MNKKLTIVGVMILTVFLGLPVAGATSATVTETSLTTGSGPQISLRIGQPRRRRSRRGVYWRDGRQYRNYGQFRRTQVGNRRYRLVRRYYWDDGIRRVRYVRYYY